MKFLADKIDEEVKNKVIPGISYAIIQDGVVNIGCRGYQSLVPNIEKVTSDTIYDVASLSKVIVTVPLILKLIECGKLSFEDKIQKYLPDFRYNDVTVYHLLTHTSGLSSGVMSKKIMSREDLIKEVYAIEKEYVTGSEVIYSDLGYILLGEIIEKLYEKPLDVVASQELFLPLDMKNTSYNPSKKLQCAPTEVTQERGLLRGFVHDEKAYSMGGVAGHAGVFSTAQDLSHYVSMILNNGEFEGKRILSKKMVDLLFEPLVYDKKLKWHRSFCFIVGKNKIVIDQGKNVISFSGFTGPSISIDRERQIGIVLMTNRVHPTRDNKLISKERPKISEEIYQNLVKVKKG